MVGGDQLIDTVYVNIQAASFSKNNPKQAFCG